MPLPKRYQHLYLKKKNNILLKYNLWGSQTRLCSVTAAQLWTDFNQLIRRRWRRIRRQVTRLCEFWYHNAIYDMLQRHWIPNIIKRVKQLSTAKTTQYPSHMTSSLFPIPLTPRHACFESVVQFLSLLTRHRHEVEELLTRRQIHRPSSPGAQTPLRAAGK